MIPGLLPAAPALRHNALIEAVAFSVDARFLASADAEGMVKVWDIHATGAVVADSGLLWRRSTFTPDGTRFATTDGNGRLWFDDARSGRPDGPPLDVPNGHDPCAGSSPACSHGRKIPLTGTASSAPPPRAPISYSPACSIRSAPPRGEGMR